MVRFKNQGWTLAELMVVVAIIGIVLSLLSTAIDKAHYEATLTRCHTDQKSIGVAVVTYAGEFKGHYPYRTGVQSDPDWSPNVIADNEAEVTVKLKSIAPLAPGASLVDNDDRPVLRAFLQINKQLNCNMVRPVELDEARDRTRVMASQAIWAGWRYLDSTDQPLKGMVKLGDRFEWNNTRFPILASDWTTFSREDNYAIGSHPDYYDGIMNAEWAENAQTFWWLADPVTYSFWVSPNSSWPGPVDRSFCYDDGSVQRLTRVSWRPRLGDSTPLLGTPQDWETSDERMVRVPERAKDDPTRSTHLPRE